jgi:kynurenine 3-monooxygenase
MGDAAHAIVPFYGQGMNASFEDVVEFDTFLDEHKGDWEATFKAYENSRKKDTDAIADLAIDNFHEMKGHVNNAIFREKRNLEMAFEQHFPKDYSSKYSLVTFNENIGYHEAMSRGRAQDKAILNMLTENEIELNPEATKDELYKILQKVITETNAILKDDDIAGL